jgi:glycosyltransferase involved in cell wall biosynthesis
VTEGRAGQPASRARVALLFASLSGGGVERNMLQLAGAFLERGLAVDLVVGQAKGELLADVPPQARVVELRKRHLLRSGASGIAAAPEALRLLPRTRPLKPLWRRLPALAGYLRSARPSTVLAAEPRYNAMAVWARRLSRLDCRVVLSEHIHASSHAAASPWADQTVLPLLRRAYGKADAIVTASLGVADDLAARVGIPRDQITTIYNPVVAPNLPAKAREALDHPWFAAGQPPVILAAGRLQPQKDFASLIRAFARVRTGRPVQLVILGAGADSDYAVALKTLAAELGVSPHIEMPGFTHNPFAYMSRAAVFVLSSRYEGLGNVLIEALACGTPVVSTDCPSGPREILQDGQFGPLVPVGDVSALAQAIEKVLDDPPAAERLQARALQFTVEQAAEGYLDLLFPAR